MTPLTAVLICAIIYAIGDYVSNRSRAMLPMLFVSGFLLLIGFWTVYQSMVHFYFDGFLWKMRSPTIRATVGA